MISLLLFVILIILGFFISTALMNKKGKNPDSEVLDSNFKDPDKP